MTRQQPTAAATQSRLDASGRVPSSRLVLAASGTEPIAKNSAASAEA